MGSSNQRNANMIRIVAAPVLAFSVVTLLELLGSSTVADAQVRAYVANFGDDSVSVPLSAVRFWVKGLLMPKGDEYRRHAAECDPRSRCFSEVSPLRCFSH
jgi:hypothetical protein